MWADNRAHRGEHATGGVLSAGAPRTPSAVRIARGRRELADRVAELTARELQIVRLVGTGRGNREIAEELRISEATVKTHLNRAMPKLGVSTRAQAVVIAYEAGLVRVGSRLPPDRR